MALSERDGLTLLRRTLTASVRAETPDLTARQQAIFLTIALMPGPHTVRGLAQYLSIAKPAVTRALDTLEKLDLVRRIRDDQDMRNVFLERTRGGGLYLRTIGQIVVEAQSNEPRGRDNQAVA